MSAMKQRLEMHKAAPEAYEAMRTLSRGLRFIPKL